MGMAVMLDEIINYVQSLQNQVEVSQSIDNDQVHCYNFYTSFLKKLINQKNLFCFLEIQFLSMKLTAASSFHDFNSETDEAMETMQVY